VVSSSPRGRLACDLAPYLRIRKSRKFMAPQDELAVIAAGRALESAGLLHESLGEETGLFMAVGYLPFAQEEIDTLLRASIDEDEFSMAKFSTAGMDSVNPLLTFHCLPNMAAFHVSVNFEIQGPYVVTYPGPGQFYLALDEACQALSSGRAQVALVMGVAHQRNFLVEHHFARVKNPVPSERLANAAGCIVLESHTHLAQRGGRVRGRLRVCDIRYKVHDPFEESPLPGETFLGPESVSAESYGCLGAASLPVFLSLALSGDTKHIHHQVQSRDGLVAASHWELF
jgi:hypothetical protein